MLSWYGYGTKTLFDLFGHFGRMHLFEDNHGFLTFEFNLKFGNSFNSVRFLLDKSQPLLA